MIAFDFETSLIAPGLQFPPAACATFAAGNDATILHAHDPRIVDALRATFEGRALGANTAFDAGVACVNYPELAPLVFDAYERDRVECVQVRQKLIDIGLGCYRGFRHVRGSLRKIGYDLGSLAERHEFPSTVDKANPWRLRFGELTPHPLEQWPAEAVAYAIDDARATWHVRQAQERFAPLLADQHRQARYDFALKLTSANGLITDPIAVPFFERAIDEAIGQCRERLEHERVAYMGAKGPEVSALVRDDGSRNTKAAAARMLVWCYRESLPVKFTEPSARHPRGQVALDADTCYEAGDPILALYADYSQLLAVKSKDLEFLTRGTREPIHCRYEVLVETGRTSSSKPNVQNLRTLAGIREAFIPRAGYVFACADFGGLELATMAQACLEIVGWSRLAEVLNAGRDPHLEVAAKILHRSYESLFVDGERIDEIDGHPERHAVYKARQTGKVANFGFPGGLGVATLVEYARALYDVILTEAEARDLKRAWLETFPEFRRYFAIVGETVEAGRGISQLFVGRHRGRVTYTSACNTLFQGLGADVAKLAGWSVVRGCYAEPGSPLFGSHPVAFVHDEWILEVPEHRAHEAAEELSRRMIEAAGKLLRGVRITAKPLLSRRWSKKARAIRDSAGRLVVWDRPYLDLLREGAEAEAKAKAKRLTVRA